VTESPPSCQNLQHTARNQIEEGSTISNVLPSSAEIRLEVKPKFRSQRTRRYVVRAAEG
jgi:hypothetical protein